MRFIYGKSCLKLDKLLLISHLVFIIFLSKAIQACLLNTSGRNVSICFFRGLWILYPLSLCQLLLVVGFVKPCLPLAHLVLLPEKLEPRLRSLDLEAAFPIFSDLTLDHHGLLMAGLVDRILLGSSIICIRPSVD